MILAISLAGGVGAAARYVVDRALTHRPICPILTGTFVVNVLGSFLLGLLTGGATPSWALDVLGVGFCGGFTTFSTASLDAVRLAAHAGPLRAISYALGTLIAAVTAAALGHGMGQLL